MNPKQYRKRRLANQYAKANRISVARAMKCTEAQEKLMAVLAPLKPKVRLKVLKIAAIMFDLEMP